MQVTIRVIRTYPDGTTAQFDATAESIEGAIAAADQFATGKAGAAPAAKETPAAKKDSAKDSPAKTADAQNTAGEKTKEPEAGASDKKDMPGVSYEDVRASILAVSKAKGREITVALLQRFGVASGKDLKVEQYAEMIATAAKVVDGTYDPMASDHDESMV